MGGEFGRTPRIGDVTPDGRSHWPAGFLWVAGGGLKTGQIIGATDARGAQIVDNPIRRTRVAEPARLAGRVELDQADATPSFSSWGSSR